MPGASEQRLPSRRCPLHHSCPLSPFWGHSPGLGIGWLKGPGVEIRRDSWGLKCGPVWPLPGSLSRSNLDLQKSLFFPLGPQLTLGGLGGTVSSPSRTSQALRGERRRGGAGLLPCPQPSPGETAAQLLLVAPEQTPLCPRGGGSLSGTCGDENTLGSEPEAPTQPSLTLLPAFDHKNPRTEEPGGLQAVGSSRVGQD